jgi:O-antigen ligase
LNPVIWGQHETHNSYIKVAAETGLAGFIPFMTLVVFTLREAYRLRKHAQSESNALARAAMRAALPTACGFVLIAFFLSQSWSWYFYVMFGQVAAMGVLRTNAVGARDAVHPASQRLVQRRTA